MLPSKATIRIIGSDECPLYKVGTEFMISGKAIVGLYELPACLILAADMLEALKKYDKLDTTHRAIFDCSGCTGLVRLEYVREEARNDLLKNKTDLESIVHLLSRLPFFQSLDENNIIELVSFLKLKKFPKGKAIIRKGDPGENLFIIVSGKVEVLGDQGIRMATLGTGEIFGEMSLLSGDPVGATIKVLEPARVLYLNGEDFRKVLHRFPSLQMYLACLLARRLADMNALRVEEFASSIVGNLADMPPADLFQTLHQNLQTGSLELELPEGNAEVIFKDGELIRVTYGKMEGKDAFFKLLAQTSGRFKFSPQLAGIDHQTPPMGDFMGLLMRGLKELDDPETKKFPH